MQVLTFLLEKEIYTIDTKNVIEIDNMLPLTKVPNAKAHVIGLANLRGSVVPVIDIKMILNIPRKEPEAKIIIINYNGEKIAISVNDIDEVIDITEDNIEMIATEKPTTVVNLNGRIITLIGNDEMSLI